MDVARLKDLMYYNPDLGIFTWLKGVKKGKKAGTRESSGYIKIKIDGKDYKAHRLAFLYMYGFMPDEIDHINHDKTDNRILNIRSVTHAENCKNLKKSKNNTSGLNGISYDKTNNLWRSRITVNGKAIYLGRRRSFFDACCLRKSAENKYGFHKNHGGVF